MADVEIAVVLEGFRLLVETLLGLLGLCFFTYKKRRMVSQFQVTVERIISFGVDNEVNHQLSAINDKVVNDWGKHPDQFTPEHGPLYHIKMLWGTAPHGEPQVEATVRKYMAEPGLSKYCWPTLADWRKLTAAKMDLATIKGHRRRAMQDVRRLWDAVTKAGKPGG